MKLPFVEYVLSDGFSIWHFHIHLQKLCKPVASRNTHIWHVIWKKKQKHVISLLVFFSIAKSSPYLGSSQVAGQTCKKFHVFKKHIALNIPLLT